MLASFLFVNPNGFFLSFFFSFFHLSYLIDRLGLVPYISSLDSSTTDSYLAASEASTSTVPLPATPNLTTRKGS